MRIGLLGGTFDPPHIVHMVVAEAAYRQYRLDKVWFLPAGDPWQKAGTEVTAAAHRWAMTVAATSDIPYFEADDREILRSGSTFTIDTLTDLVGVEPFLILGADAASGLASWHRADEVIEKARFIVAPRSGTGRALVERAVGERVGWLDLPPLDLSGSEIRRRVADGRSLRFLVREPVRRYIELHGLYRHQAEDLRFDSS